MLDRINKGFNQLKALGKGLYFLTLTVGSGSAKDKKGIVRDQKDIKWFFQRFRSLLWKYGISFSYCWIMEFQPNSGNRHLHLIYSYDEDLDQEFLVDLWQKATLFIGRGVDIRYVTGIRNAAGYIGKYITKAVESMKYAKNEHHFGFSSDSYFKKELYVADKDYRFRLCQHFDPSAYIYISHKFKELLWRKTELKLDRFIIEILPGLARNKRRKTDLSLAEECKILKDDWFEMY